MDSLLVKVTSESFDFHAVTLAKLAIDELIAPLCIGQDATRIDPLDRSGTNLYQLSLRATHYTARSYGRHKAGYATTVGREVARSGIWY